MKKINRIDTELMRYARSAMKSSHSPYSKFKVGAALRTKSGKIFTGCNIENISYGLTICAERVAVFNAISAGHTKFKAMAISSSIKNKTIYPCGACRQVLAEFAKNKNFVIYVDKDDHNYNILDLLPHSFSKEQMK